MSKNLIDISIVGLKCDNETCDYEDNTVKFEDYDQYLNKPCPECGESLLTPEDLETSKQMRAIANMINGMGEALFPEGDEKFASRVQVELKMKGDGSVEFGEIKDD